MTGIYALMEPGVVGERLAGFEILAGLIEYEDGQVTYAQVRDYLGIAPGSAVDTDLQAIWAKLDAQSTAAAKLKYIFKLLANIVFIERGLYLEAKSRSSLGI